MRYLNDWAHSLLSSAGIATDGKRPFDIVVRDPRIFSRIFWTGMLGLGDGYVDGQWDCASVDQFIDRTARADVGSRLGYFIETLQALRDRLFNLQSVRRAFVVGERHYDLGNELYAEMLGPTMGYSSGYYRDGAQTLDEAQYAKFDRICRLLKLKPGMRVLEVGCGWGTFAQYAAENYSVSVVGISVSREQLKFADEHKGTLPIEFHLVDYRNMPTSWRASFDAVVSVEMIEAVGVKNFRTFMSTIAEALKPGGTFMMQVIVGSGIPDSWISTRIFPNGVLPSIRQIAVAIENLFDIEDVESFGEDYDRTLMEWHARFEKAWPTIKLMRDEKGILRYDERFRRMWHYYLLLCAGGFRSRKFYVSQMLMSKRS